VAGAGLALAAAATRSSRALRRRAARPSLAAAQALPTRTSAREESSAGRRGPRADVSTPAGFARRGAPGARPRPRPRGTAWRSRWRSSRPRLRPTCWPSASCARQPPARRRPARRRPPATPRSCSRGSARRAAERVPGRPRCLSADAPRGARRGPGRRRGARARRAAPAAPRGADEAPALTALDRARGGRGASSTAQARSAAGDAARPGRRARAGAREPPGGRSADAAPAVARPRRLARSARVLERRRREARLRAAIALERAPDRRAPRTRLGMREHAATPCATAATVHRPATRNTSLISSASQADNLRICPSMSAQASSWSCSSSP
jgi:hypothetical protein